MSDAPPSLLSQIRRLLVLGLPLVGSSVAAFLIHTTDIIMLGWYDVISLAAATIGAAIWFLLFILGAGFGNAVLPIAAGAIATGDTVRARRVTRMALWLSLGYSILTIPPLWWSEALMLAIGQTPEVAAEAQRFLRFAMWGMFPALAGNALRAYLGAWRLTAVQLWITLGGLVLNGVVGYGLIFGLGGLPEMGISGAGLSASILQTATALAVAAYAVWRLPEARLFQRIWKIDLPALTQVLRVGLPIGITAISEAGLFTATATMMGWIGAIELAAHGVTMQIAALAFMFHVGMAQAAIIEAGSAFGRRDEAALRLTGRAAITLAVGFGILAVTLFLTLPTLMLGAFIDPTEPARDAILAVGTVLLALGALFQFFDSAQIVALSLLRGVQDTRIPMWLAAFSYWIVGMPSGYLIGVRAGYGAPGIWMGLVIGLMTSAALLMWRFWGRSVQIANA